MVFVMKNNNNYWAVLPKSPRQTNVRPTGGIQTDLNDVIPNSSFRKGGKI